VQEHAADAPNILERTLGPVAPTGTADRYQYTGTYHGIVHSHLDSLDYHMMVDGKGYNGVAMEDITAAGGCPKGSINALKDGIVTRAILFDATLLPGRRLLKVGLSRERRSIGKTSRPWKNWST
jgi:hypothetical protein